MIIDLTKIPDNDYKVLENYAQTHELDVIKVTHVTGVDTVQYILHLHDRDMLVKITDNRVEHLEDTKDEGEYGMGGDWWKDDDK